MRKIVTLFFIVFLLCGCSTPQVQENEAELVPESSGKEEANEPIPPFEKEEREILSLPEQKDISEDPLEFVDTLIAGYEVKHLVEFGEGFKSLAKPLNKYFETPDNHYGVLVRFKADDTGDLCFNLDSRFGRIMLDFYEDIYPAIDVSGDSYGDPMLYDDWNNYIYEAGEWACVFITINNFGQKTCYVWGEDDPTDFNFIHSFGGEPYGDDTPFEFAIQVGVNGETVTVSDIWLFSYEEAKV